jgi:hypothetical protein
MTLSEAIVIFEAYNEWRIGSAKTKLEIDPNRLGEAILICSDFLRKIPNDCGFYGRFQKGNRYFFKIGDKIYFDQGFKSKKDCNEWIESVRDLYLFNFRIGFSISFRRFDNLFILVDRKGNMVRY